MKDCAAAALADRRIYDIACNGMGRAIPLLWQPLEHPSVCVSTRVVTALLEKAAHLLAGFDPITLLVDRGYTQTRMIQAWQANTSKSS